MSTSAYFEVITRQVSHALVTKTWRLLVRLPKQIRERGGGRHAAFSNRGVQRGTDREPCLQNVAGEMCAWMPYIGTGGMEMCVVRFAPTIHLTPFKQEVLGLCVSREACTPPGTILHVWTLDSVVVSFGEVLVLVSRGMYTTWIDSACIYLGKVVVSPVDGWC